MRTPRRLLLLLVLAWLPIALSAQQATSTLNPTATSDPRAATLVQKALAAMGGAPPTDSVATGTVTLVEGSLTTRGTIRILTRGLDQSSEQIQTPDVSDTVVYSRGQGRETLGSTANELPLERSITSLSPDFLVVLLNTTARRPCTFSPARK